MGVGKGEDVPNKWHDTFKKCKAEQCRKKTLQSVGAILKGNPELDGEVLKGL